MNQILEGMLRACALTNSASWDVSLSYAKFSYNNSYQSSLQILPFEALYGRKCRTPLYWNETRERQVFGPDVLKEAKEQVQKIRENLKIAQTKQKSYADNRRRDLTFALGDHVYLKVSPLKGMRRFRVSEKLALRYIGPFLVLVRREVTYKLKLPPQLSNVHDVFHVSQLKKCLRVPEEQIPLEEVELKDDLTYQEYPVRILEERERRTRSKTIKFYKVQWSNHSKKETTCEREQDLRVEYSNLFPVHPNLGVEIPSKGGRFATSQNLHFQKIISKLINSNIWILIGVFALI